MADRTKILNMISALRETDKSQGFFRAIVQRTNLSWRFQITEFDKLGILVNHIAITAHDAPPISLERQFDRLKKKITYLEEDFELVEHDRNRRMMMLRSSIPQQLEHAINYYEIL